LKRKEDNNSQDKSVEPVAIIGMAFHFPGDLSDEHSFCEALKEGRDAVGRLGRERWAVDELQHPKRSEPERSVTFSAGILSRIEEFDADFFGISPRQAEWLDPQQRLLLELAWEAMENSEQAPSLLAATNVAGSGGISGIDYGLRKLDDLSSLTAHQMTGNTLSRAANRISYVFDLCRPSVAMDTACSSSRRLYAN
jgi:acyl transferase domain-containing protein